MSSRWTRPRCLLYILYIVGLPVAINYGFYYHYMLQEPANTMPDHFESWKNTDPVTRMRIGMLYLPRSSSYTNFTVIKPAGVTRIGCFGDSYTYGAEVDGDLDYPSQLKQLLDQHGIPNVEVLNFGISAIGFHQTYLLWEAVGRQFGLDYVLLGPQCFQWDRDSSFHGPHLPFPSHSRYILKGTQAVLIDPVGDTPYERLKAYRRFLPPYRYLRYERLTPLFIKVMLPKGRDLPVNPFYYRDSPKGDAYDTYQVLLKNLAQTGVQVLLVHWSKEILDLAPGIEYPNCLAVKYEKEWFKRFPLEAAAGHYGPIGNRVIARLFLDLLTGETTTDFLNLELHQVHETPQPLSESLNNLTDLGFSINGQVVSRLTIPSLSPSVDEPSNLRGTQIQSFIILHRAGTPLNTCAFIPCTRLLSANEKLVLRLKIGKKISIHELAAVKTLAPGAGFGFVEFGKEEYARLNEGLFALTVPQELSGVFFGAERPSELSLLLGDTLLLESTIIDLAPDAKVEHFTVGIKAEFKAVAAQERYLYADPLGKLAIEQAPESGTLDLYARDSDRNLVQIPVFDWVKSSRTLQVSDRGIEKPLKP